ncbi:hypothetical protein VT84_30660 [Gemmata sp. SH-PL17]|uniref:hypothetical protein n=1 Tax=Gemmata sp. SH-PL17 TaxID=1630693 RepID=UPI00078E2F82|nr:hypothetical protein [Gemmata sp. SH-PL17]AMV28795.1 hypothetical protein VT84_30660 [Gemmata sp. SH-PL17]
MSKQRPLDIEDDDRPRPHSRPALPPPGAVAAGFFNLAKWFALGAAAMLAAVAITQGAVWASAFAGLACFVAIVARILQAEEHIRRR